MKIRASDLTDDALDWAVTRANYEINHEAVWEKSRSQCKYSTDWAEAGPLIEREEISVVKCYITGGWTAKMLHKMTHRPVAVEDGPTALVAAMRCYVAQCLGDIIEVPDELIQE
jgi:hypothetical protein